MRQRHHPLETGNAVRRKITGWSPYTVPRYGGALDADSVPWNEQNVFAGKLRVYGRFLRECEPYPTHDGNTNSTTTGYKIGEGTTDHSRRKWREVAGFQPQG